MCEKENEMYRLEENEVTYPRAVMNEQLTMKR
jgi:hypothetical protein